MSYQTSYTQLSNGLWLNEFYVSGHCKICGIYGPYQSLSIEEHGSVYTLPLELLEKMNRVLVVNGIKTLRISHDNVLGAKSLFNPIIRVLGTGPDSLQKVGIVVEQIIVTFGSRFVIESYSVPNFVLLENPLCYYFCFDQVPETLTLNHYDSSSILQTSVNYSGPQLVLMSNVLVYTDTEFTFCLMNNDILGQANLEVLGCNGKMYALRRVETDDFTSGLLDLVMQLYNTPDFIETKKQKISEDTICAITHDTIGEFYTQCDLCRQVFDFDALAEWLEQSRTCPVCRAIWTSQIKFQNCDPES